MEEERLCIACGADLVGPFQPRITLTRPAPPAGPGPETRIAASSWICPGCGLLHWYAPNEDLEKLLALLPGVDATATPGASYERRSQVLRMLRRVRRM